MQEGETGHTVKKGHDRRTRIEAFLIRTPRLQRATGNRQDLGGLTQGWRGSLLVSTLTAGASLCFWGLIYTKWPTR